MQPHEPALRAADSIAVPRVIALLMTASSNPAGSVPATAAHVQPTNAAASVMIFLMVAILGHYERSSSSPIYGARLAPLRALAPGADDGQQVLQVHGAVEVDIRIARERAWRRARSPGGHHRK